MIDILFADCDGRISIGQHPDDEPLPDELTIPCPVAFTVEGKFAGWEPGQKSRWLRNDLHYAIYIPGEGLRRHVIHLYKPAPLRSTTAAVQNNTAPPPAQEATLKP